MYNRPPTLYLISLVDLLEYLYMNAEDINKSQDARLPLTVGRIRFASDVRARLFQEMPLLPSFCEQTCQVRTDICAATKSVQLFEAADQAATSFDATAEHERTGPQSTALVDAIRRMNKIGLLVINCANQVSASHEFLPVPDHL
jgi:hypothetical protein